MSSPELPAAEPLGPNAASHAGASATVRGRVRRAMAAGWLMAGGKNDGPPDLDELWRDFNRTLGKLFGNGPKGGRPDEPQEPRPPAPRGPRPPTLREGGVGLGIALVVAALIWLGSGFFIVQEGQQSIITTFGRYARTVDAGFHWRLPYPFQAQETVSVTQLRSVDVGRGSAVQASGLREASMLTQDENIVDVRFTVQYRLKDARQYLFENRDPDLAVEQASESAVREIVGRSKVDSVLYEARDALATDLAKSIQVQLDRLSAGIQIVAVNVQHVGVPEAVQAAFNDAVRASADRDRFKNEGQAYASDIIPKARGTAARLKEQAAGYGQRVVAQAEGDAQRFESVLTEYRKAPQVTRDRLYIDTMQQIYANTQKVMVDVRAGSPLLMMPLDKLIGATSSPAASAAAVPATPTGSEAPQPTPAPAAAPPDPRSRDSARTRDREGR